MKRTLGLTAVSLIVVLASAGAGMAQTVVENFESYKNGQVVGSSYNSKPWRRFGEATNDNVIATAVRSKVISGKMSGLYGVFWPNRFASAMCAFDAARDLSQNEGMSLKMRSNEPATKTRVRLSVTDGNTTYLSRDSQALTDQVQDFAFTLSVDDMERVDGTGDYDSVVKGATAVGFQLEAPKDAQYLETINFDDLTLTVKAEASAKK